MTSAIQTLILALTDIKRWTWRAVLAIALLLLAYVLPRVVFLDVGVTDILDTGNMIGLALLMAEIARARAETPPPKLPPVLLVLLALGWASSGCGPRTLQLDADDEPPMFVIDRGPPCRMSLVAEGEVQASVEHAGKRCRLRVDGTEVP